MTWLSWVGVGLGSWMALSLPAAIGVGRALARLSRELPAPASATPNLRAV